jgi:hypothetical protein
VGAVPRDVPGIVPWARSACLAGVWQPGSRRNRVSQTDSLAPQAVWRVRHQHAGGCKVVLEINLIANTTW